jgi:hypothetical protein
VDRGHGFSFEARAAHGRCDGRGGRRIVECRNAVRKRALAAWPCCDPLPRPRHEPVLRPLAACTRSPRPCSITDCPGPPPNLPEGNEAALRAEIESWFPDAGVAGAQVAADALANIARMPKWNNVNFGAADAVRGVYHVNKPFNCYNACVFWAFQAGAISKRYLWNKLQGKDGNAFFPVFSQVGWTTILEMRPDGTNEIDTTGVGPIVIPAGRTIYFETPAKVFGHVACSLGDGRVISQNSVNIGDTKLNALPAPIRPEFDKMANAITHVVSIRDMIAQYFNPANGYRSVQVTNGNFWDPIPQADR